MSNPLPPPATTLEATIMRIVGHELTAGDREMLIMLRDQYGIDDGDPMVVALAMTGAVKVMVDQIPEMIAKESEKITELHITGLRNQSILIAKDLVGVIAGQIHAASRTRRGRLVDAAIGGLVGVTATLIFGFVIYLKFSH